MLIGSLASAPPLASDIKWRQAQNSRSAQELEKSLIPSYLNPINSFAINNVVGVFETSGIPDLAHKYALQAVAFNPDSYDSWKNLYLISGSSEIEKLKALKNMKRLDPKNPNIGSSS